MDEAAILKRIIDNKGSCNWANPDVCALCPLGRLKARPEGGWFSCLESLGAWGSSDEECDSKYLEAANKKLLELQIEEVLEE